MEEINKNVELDSENVENNNVENNVDAPVAQSTVENNETASQAENAETAAPASEQPKAEAYYTYEQGTLVTPNENLAAASAPAGKDKAKSKATTALVLGIIALVSNCLCCGCCLPIPVILGIISIVMANKSKKLSADGKLSGLAIGALICSIFAIISYVIIVLITGLYTALILSDPEGKKFINDFLAEYGYELAF